MPTLDDVRREQRERAARNAPLKARVEAIVPHIAAAFIVQGGQGSSWFHRADEDAETCVKVAEAIVLKLDERYGS